MCPEFASVSLTAQVIMEVFVLYSTAQEQFVQQPHPSQLIQAPSSLSLTRPQYLLNDTKPAPGLCTVQPLYNSTVQFAASQLALVQLHCTGKEAAAATTDTHTLFISS